MCYCNNPVHQYHHRYHLYSSSVYPTIYHLTSIGVFNNGLCPNWNFVGPDDPECGRLPWLFNVEAAVFESKQSGVR